MSSAPIAVVFEQPGQMNLRPVGLPLPEAGDCVVEVEWTGISTGTERLLWDGRMPPFPGLGYPLVPGYECVGRIQSRSGEAGPEPGTRVFVPGSRGFTDVRGLFGGAAAQLVVPGERLVSLADSAGEESVLLALAATAHHAAKRAGDALPQLIIGHGVLGRLLARLVIALGGEAPTVWETSAARRSGASHYPVIDPSDDTRSDYRSICDVSGDANLLDTLIGRLGPGGQLLLAGFYHEPLHFQFAPAFSREIDIRVAAEWQPADMEAAAALVASGDLSLAGLISHRQPATHAESAYRTAFGDPDCIKMILDWRDQ
ncbi:MAG: chlorophyll synthesis pathway protein BchC [Pseudomonadota bacterium]